MFLLLLVLSRDNSKASGGGKQRAALLDLVNFLALAWRRHGRIGCLHGSSVDEQGGNGRTGGYLYCPPPHGFPPHIWRFRVWRFRAGGAFSAQALPRASMIVYNLAAGARGPAC